MTPDWGRADVAALVGREAERLELKREYERAWGDTLAAHELADRVIAEQESQTNGASRNGDDPSEAGGVLEGARVDLIERIREGIPEREYVPGGDGWLIRGKRYLVFSPSGVGKSLGWLIAAVEIVRARGTVVIIDVENGGDEYARRLEMIIGDGAELASACSERLRYYEYPTRQDIQVWADSLEGAPSTVRNAVTALRALYGWAIPRGLAHVNPTRELRLPSGEKVRDRIASPTAAAALVQALQPRDQALFGLAVYAGLRLGEILALRWHEIDLEGLTLRVERSWDASSREFVEPKSRAGTRTVPIIDRLALLLGDHRVLTNHPTGGLLFESDRVPGQPVHPVPLRRRMYDAWRNAKLEPLGLHEARHTFASMMIAAGVNAKALSGYLGHANIAITFDRYGHLMPGSEAEARDRLNAYLK